MLTKTHITLIGVAIVLLIGSFFVGCERIDAGSVGIKVNAVGDDRGATKTQYVNGLQFYVKGLSRIYEYPINQQPTEYKIGDVPEDFVVASKGGTPFILHPAFSFSVNPDKADIMFQNLRVDMDQLRNGYIKQALKGAIREVSNTFSPDSMLNNVTIYDAAVTEALAHKLSPYFSISQYTSNIIPDPSLKESLQKKAVATQEAQALENEKKKIKVQVENDLLEAARDSAVLVMAAKAEALSIKVKQEALQQSPQYIDLIRAEKWNGVLPVTMLGSGSNTLFNIK